jgi:diguanylate cyclase (GGDEF)-like protein
MIRRKGQDTEEIENSDLTKRDRKSEDSPPPGESSFSIGFTVIHGHELDFGKHFNFSGGSLIIGREKNNRISLEDEKVSKKHCEVSIIRTWDLEEVILKDLDSTNGTYLNGKPIRKAVLKTGDKIGLGDTVLRFSYNDLLEEEYHSRLFTFAATDSLTGLYNRRYTINELENQSRIARRNNREFSIAVFDIDNFKQINDDYGHLAGDDYLKRLSLELTQCLREQDICGRIGGEEFLVILPETPLEGALHLANRVREKVRNIELTNQDRIIQTTISGGVSQFGLHASESRALFEKADLALQAAKKSGKNMIIQAELEKDEG